MKKTLLLGLTLLGGLAANAQQAPDFTATDINGNVHSISDYLAEGKTVLIDISATWCGPCWSFHNLHTLENMYNTYGPGGSDEIVVLFVEGDNSTTMADLQGTGTNTQGDWITGVSYPIIDDGSISDAFNLVAFPSLYKICPDGTYTQIPNAQMGDINNIINSVGTCGEITGASNHAKIHMEDLRLCGEDTSTTTEVAFTNYGTNVITTATLNLKDSEGTVVATKNYAGNLAKYATTTVTFDETDIAIGDYTVEVTAINTGTPYSEANAEFTAELTAETAINVWVKVYTDNYPSEISWAIKDSNGNVAASGGPYQPGTADEFGGGGVDANTTKSHYVVLPETIDCYTVEMYDSYGDGWIYGSTDHGIEIFTHDEATSIFRKEVGSLNFGEELVTPSAFRTNGTLNNEVFEIGKFAVYPNPTSGILNFTTQEPVNLTVLDITGKVVFTANDINDGQSVNLSSLQTGMYIAKINSQTAERIEKIVIK